MVLDPETVDAAIASSAWERHGGEIVLTRPCGDFAGSLAFVNAVGRLAEEANHHPDVDIRWATVTLRLSTHSQGGITRADLDLAAGIDALG